MKPGALIEASEVLAIRAGLNQADRQRSALPFFMPSLISLINL
jgi:hypothetical protein